jgi:DNA-3-methyladenine glycosylase
MPGDPFDRAVLRGLAVDVAPLLLGAVVRKGGVAVEVTEVEAYLGDLDPGSHAFRGRTARNAVMFGPAGHLYTYFTYGMHVCANVVCGEEGQASGILLRAGRVVEGLKIARARRSTSKSDDDLARGPARLAVALGITPAVGEGDPRIRAACDSRRAGGCPIGRRVRVPECPDPGERRRTRGGSGYRGTAASRPTASTCRSVG